MTAETQAAEATAGRVPSPYTERVVTHVTPRVALRLRMQSALLDRPPAHLVDEVLDRGLMTFEEISAQTLQQNGNGNGAR
jgi:hypothetical protein